MRYVHSLGLIVVITLFSCGEQKPSFSEDMVEVKEGAFWMGDSLCGDEAIPVHRIFLSSFFIDRHEVTNQEFAEFLNAEPEAAGELSLGENGSRIFRKGRKFMVEQGYERYPVSTVTWRGARDFALWRGVRLPTEAEWEKAACGTGGLAYPWGADFRPGFANCSSDSLTPVGSFPMGASPYGVLDMAGNAWEWVADAFARDYYASSPERDPHGPVFDGRYRVLRGGSFKTDSLTMRCAFRGHHYPSKAIQGVGFRCARDAP